MTIADRGFSNLKSRVRKRFNQTSALKNASNELGADFGLWFASLISLALNSKLIAASIMLEADIPSNMDIGDDNEVFADNYLLSHNTYESFEEFAQVLVGEIQINSDSDIS